ncbi:hypothetical protein ACPB8Q_03140 [Methanocaldococcus indicus]|uniref:hypothetical protein n=1 Tax=Methanocaldococcus indicus TaxID=213231 RepID=UPI003C6DA47B
MDVYDILFNLCLEYEVKYKDRKLPLWKVKEENINIDEVDLNLPWENIRELAIYLYEISKKQKESNELISFDIIKVLVGIAFLKDDKSNFMSLVNDNTCLNYLSEIINYRINCIARYYYMIRYPKNTNIFDDIILKFPINRELRVNNFEDFKRLVYKLREFINSE